MPRHKLKEVVLKKNDRMQAESKEFCEEKEKLEKEIEKLKEESKELRLITENQKFDITKIKEKVGNISNFIPVFLIGMH